MFKNYLKIAWRNLLKNKTFSLINIAGLASGLACFILITLYIIDELSYDRFHEKADRIYRVHSDIRFGGTDMSLAVTSDPMGATLKKDYPQAKTWFTELIANFPSAAKVPDAQLDLGKVYFLMGDKAKARSLLSEVAAGSTDAARLAQKFLSDNF